MSKKKSGILYPGYNYLGPGNDLSREDPIVNSTDFIAYVHDLEYAVAHNTRDIQEADKKAIVSFLKDFRGNGRIADLAGILGLSAKYGFEKIFGVVYGMDIGKQSFTDYLFSVRNQHIKDTYEAHYKEKFVNLNEFRKSQHGQSLYYYYRKNQPGYRRVLDDYNSYHKTPVSAEPAVQENPQPGPSRRPADTSDEPPTKYRVIEQPRQESSEIISPLDIPSLDTGLSNIDLSDIFNTSFNSEASDTGEANQTANIPMDVSAESGSGRGPNVGARQGASGVNPSGGSSNKATDSNVIWIRPSIPATGNSVTFKKSRILISHGYAVNNIQLNAPDFIECVTTSLALIPVDFLPHYITYAEYLNLPIGSTVKKVYTRVTPLGTRTAFDVGTTLSGTATSEYIPIGLVAEGLNVEFYGRNRKIKSDATDPMKPSGLEVINPTEIADRYYKHVQSNSLCVPQHIDEYFVHEWNRSAHPNINNNDLVDYQIHNSGVVRMDEKIHQFLINSSIGQPIVEYSYEPRHGIIRSTKEHFIPWNRRSNRVETSFARPTSNLLQFFHDSENKPVIGDVGIGSQTSTFTLINQVSENYYRQLEHYGAFHPARGGNSYKAQPQLHVGLLATPQLNPAVADVKYLNSVCYWRVESSIVIEFNLNSAFSNGSPISWPLEVSFMDNQIPGYTDGQTLFGNSDSRNGNINLQSEVDEEENMDDNISGLSDFEEIRIKN